MGGDALSRRRTEAPGSGRSREAERKLLCRVSRQARRRALKHLVTRLFNGSPSLLVLNVLEDEQIDAEELSRVKKFIEDA